MSTTTTTTTTEPPAGSTVIQFSAETEAAALSAAKEGAQAAALAVGAKANEAADAALAAGAKEFEDAKAQAQAKADAALNQAGAELEAGKDAAAKEYELAKQQAAAAAEKASTAWDSMMELIMGMFQGAKSAAEDVAAREEAQFMLNIASNESLESDLRGASSNYLLHYVQVRTVELKKRMVLKPGDIVEFLPPPDSVVTATPRAAVA